MKVFKISIHIKQIANVVKICDEEINNNNNKSLHMILMHNNHFVLCFLSHTASTNSIIQRADFSTLLSYCSTPFQLAILFAN